MNTGHDAIVCGTKITTIKPTMNPEVKLGMMNVSASRKQTGLCV